MGIFTRKRTGHMPPPEKPCVHTSDSNASFGSGSSSIRSPIGPHLTSFNRSSAGSGSPPTPMTSFSPTMRIEIPRLPDPQLDPAGYLRTLHSVRERARIITEKAISDDLIHFDVDMSKFSDVVCFVANIIKRDYDAPFNTIPAFGRHQHFCVGGRDRIAHMLSTFGDVDADEKCRRLIDLYFVSVLIDAGAGSEWSYKSHENNRVYRRSEGIAIASLEMFKSGLFSSNPSNRCQVDKEALQKLTISALANGLQSHPGNEIAGLEGRTHLLVRLAAALEKDAIYGDTGRPGHLLDYLLSHPSTQATSKPIVPLPILFNTLINTLEPIWPHTRTAINGKPIGDAWPCASMPQPVAPSPTSLSAFPSSTSPGAWESILPFHKLTQWLCYSIMNPMEQLMKFHFSGTELLTGLPEYRNGGLFVDLGVLTLKDGDNERGLEHYRAYCERMNLKVIEVAPMFETSDDVIVEWRGVTVGFLDMLHNEVNKYLTKELAGNELSLAQLLEAGSWKGGREMAEVSRPNTREPPILIESDGTVF